MSSPTFPPARPHSTLERRATCPPHFPTSRVFSPPLLGRSDAGGRGAHASRVRVRQEDGVHLRSRREEAGHFWREATGDGLAGTELRAGLGRLLQVVQRQSGVNDEPCPLGGEFHARAANLLRAARDDEFHGANCGKASGTSAVRAGGISVSASSRRLLPVHKAATVVHAPGPNLDWKRSRSRWAASRVGAMAKVVEPLPDMRTMGAPLARRNS